MIPARSRRLRPCTLAEGFRSLQRSAAERQVDARRDGLLFWLNEDDLWQGGDRFDLTGIDAQADVLVPCADVQDRGPEPDQLIEQRLADSGPDVHDRSVVVHVRECDVEPRNARGDGLAPRHLHGVQKLQS